MRCEKTPVPVSLLQVFTDLAALVLAYYTTLAIRFYNAWGEGFFTWINHALGVRETGDLGETMELFYQVRSGPIILQLSVVLVALYALRELYSGTRFIKRQLVAWNIVVANALALLVVFAYFYLSRNVFHPRSFFLTLLAINTAYAVMLRAGLEQLVEFLRRRFKVGRCPVILFGAGEESGWLSVLIDETHPHGMEIADRTGRDAAVPFEKRLEDLKQCVAKHDAAMVISADTALTVPQIMQLLELSDEHDFAVKVLSPHLNVLIENARISMDKIHGLPLAHFEAPSQIRGGLWLRRATARAAAILAAIITAPFMVLLALLVRVTSRGPAFFVQERIGVNRKPFMMYKFRTMYDRAVEMQAQVEEFNESSQGLFKMRRDPRVTPVGRFLRRFSLDELPQLVNVAQDRMTVVGPRPLPRRDFERYYESWHYGRHNGLPGLTCLWQVSGRSDLDFHNMCLLDIYYLRNQGWTMDVRILGKTFWAVLFARGAY
jgi:exopolysaccharide biosynthesis polyprenyl glycosylphosphotransferase